MKYGRSLWILGLCSSAALSTAMSGLAAAEGSATTSSSTAAASASGAATPTTPSDASGAVTSGAEPGAVAVLSTASQRPTTVIEQLEFCFSLPERGADRAACYLQAGAIAKLGIEVQKCLWLLPSQVTCPAPKPFETAPDPATRAALLIKGEELADYLSQRAPHESGAQVLKVLRQSRQVLSRWVAKDRGRSTLVSQGGVSLGSWQAGFLYLTSEWEKDRALGRHTKQERTGAAAGDPSRGAFASITGASAGAVNGLATALESCRWRAPRSTADKSLYYHVWVNTLGLFGRSGMAGLYPTAQNPSERLGLFSRDGALGVALDLTKRYALEHAAEAEPGCAVDLGFSTTHLTGTQTPVFSDDQGRPIISRNSLREKFALRLQFQAECDGAKAEGGMCITNLEPPQTGYLVPRQDGFLYARLGHESHVSLSTLLRGVQASGAFPVAFPPIDLDYVSRERGKNGELNPVKKSATFVDGGTLDNTPIGLATAIDEWRDEQSSNPYLRDLLIAEPRTYIFVDPGVTSWIPTPPAELKQEKGEGVVETLLGFAGDFLASSFDSEFLDNARALPFMSEYKDHWVGPRLSVPVRHLPIAGAMFAHFMGFLEKDFRHFDFYVGMADAYEHLKREECLLNNLTDATQCEQQAATLPLIGALDSRQRKADPFYDCMRAYYDEPAMKAKERETPAARLLSQGQLPAQCQARLLPQHTAALIDDEDWEPLDQLVKDVTRDRAVEPEAEGTLTRYNFRALLVGMHNFKVWTQGVDYRENSEFEHFFSELTQAPAAPCSQPGECKHAGFVFLDLVGWLRRNYRSETLTMRLDADGARSAFRKLAQTALTEFSSKQTATSSVVLEFAGRPAADAFLTRTFPDVSLGLGYINNGLEVMLQYGLLEPLHTQLRVDIGARAFRISRRRYDEGLNPFLVTLAGLARATWVVPLSGWWDLELGGGGTVEQLWAPSSSRDRFFPGRTFAWLGNLSGTFLQRINVGLEYQFRPEWGSQLTAPFEGTFNPVFERQALTGYADFRFLW